MSTTPRQAWRSSWRARRSARASFSRRLNRAWLGSTGGLVDRPATFAALAACLSSRLLAGPVKAGASTGWRLQTASAIRWVADRSRTSPGRALRLLQCPRSHQYFSSIGRCAPAWRAGASRTLSSLRLDRSCVLASLGFRSPSTPPTLPATPLVADAPAATAAAGCCQDGDDDEQRERGCADDHESFHVRPPWSCVGEDQ